MLLTKSRQFKVVFSGTMDPVSNLKMEEELFQRIENGEEMNYLYFWVNRECLVRGQVKSARYGWYDEGLASKMNLPVLQRMSGGGVVYHDPGNLNWSFLVRRVKGLIPPETIFRGTSQYIIRALKKMQIEAYFARPNRIEVQGKKVSGLAAKSGINCLLSHGTLLVNSDLERLNSLCIPPAGYPPVENLTHWRSGLKFEDIIYAVKSVLAEDGFTIQGLNT